MLIDLLEATGVGCTTGPGEPVVAILTTDRVHELPVVFHTPDLPVLSAEVRLGLGGLTDPQVALAWCNRWNSSSRWPSCHVTLSGGGIEISGDLDFPLISSTGWEDLRDLVRQVLRFAEQAAEELSQFLESGVVIDDQSLIEFLGQAD